MMQSTEAFIAAIANFFDEHVATATDDELFACGYLRGHIDLAAGTLQLTEQPFSVPDLQEKVAQSLAQAIAGGELNSADQILVQGIWQQLQQLHHETDKVVQIS